MYFHLGWLVKAVFYDRASTTANQYIDTPLDGKVRNVGYFIVMTERSLQFCAGGYEYIAIILLVNAILRGSPCYQATHTIVIDGTVSNVWWQVWEYPVALREVSEWVSEFLLSRQQYYLTAGGVPALAITLFLTRLMRALRRRRNPASNKLGMLLQGYSFSKYIRNTSVSCQFSRQGQMRIIQ